MVADFKTTQVLFWGCGQHFPQCRLTTSTAVWSEGREPCKEGTSYILLEQATSPCITEKAKEIFSRDINLHLNTINYLLYFGSLAKRLTFKAFVRHVPRELKRQFFPDMSHTHRAQAVPSRFLNPCSLFSTAALTALLRYTQPYARSGPALLQKTLTHPEGASKGSGKEAQIWSPTDCFTTTEKS